MRQLLQKIDIILLISVLLFSAGCSKKNEELLISEPAGSLETIAETEEAVPSSEALSTADLEKPADDESNEEITLQNVMVHVCGAVMAEGVYELEPGSRVIDAVNAAGGFSEGADTAYVNQAQVLEDGVKLRIPTIEETESTNESESDICNDAGTLEAGITGSTEDYKEDVQTSPVNINTASEAQLCEIPGIGPSRAQSIIAYRDEHGKFGTIEDIMNVSGIKDKFFAKIKDHITV